MELIQIIFSFVIALIILVAIHEFGHFYVARLCGVKVLRFSIGFGQKLWSVRDRKGTEYCLAAIPLGGYVKMLDEREGEVSESELPYTFNRQSVWKRIAIVAAGPLANFLLAVVLLWGLLLRGEADLVPHVARVIPDSVAAAMGVESGQEIIEVDGLSTPTRGDLARALAKRLGETGEIKITVAYPDTNQNRQLQGRLDNWLRDSTDPDPLKGLGIDIGFPVAPVVGEVTPVSAAEQAGFRQGDRIVSANGKLMKDYREWVAFVQAHPDQEIQVLIQRGGQNLELYARPVATRVDGQIIGRLGMGNQPQEIDETYLRQREYSVVGALVRAGEKTWETSEFLLLSIKKLILGEISTKNLSGPVTIAKVAGSSAKSGLETFIGFLVMISISLAIFNLLPVPVLDGGHLFYYFIEVIRGKPLSDKVQNLGYQIGFVFIIGLSLFALYNDLTRFSH